jgi:hypothetical protein
MIRDFDDPYLELVRLLDEASEIEHALLVQYLYASFSVKERYATVIGTGGDDSVGIVGVAVQEMHHLARVNEILVQLRATPNLIRQGFPYEPDIYPFELSFLPVVVHEAGCQVGDGVEEDDIAVGHWLSTDRSTFGTTFCGLKMILVW